LVSDSALGASSAPAVTPTGSPRFRRSARMRRFSSRATPTQRPTRSPRQPRTSTSSSTIFWGEPAQRAIVALVTGRSDRSRELNWIQIGAIAGPTLQLPSVALRSANLRLQGVGQGAVSTRGYLAELPSLIEEINTGDIAVTAKLVPLADVERVWAQPDLPGERTVLLP
jgi:hypothetical protein